MKMNLSKEGIVLTIALFINLPSHTRKVALDLPEDLLVFRVISPIKFAHIHLIPVDVIIAIVYATFRRVILNHLPKTYVHS